MISWRLSLQDLMLALAWAVSPGIAQANRATVLSIGDGDTIHGMEGGIPITLCLACNGCAAA